MGAAQIAQVDHVEGARRAACDVLISLRRRWAL